ncbi:restriction endonuclease subunit S [Helicobacter pylori]|uniref:restriction endonuclease subunit S n=1 Tax=Helicobacter pylori TaxID=210 RepID=UPI000937CB47|nr:restriction endonuclease subunit S [Helicobacter pylori]OKA01954.1 type I restriction endonuclease subunit S [Helicobacter pylori]OMQ18672.1 type I restriction endonuclease subunit S [Helicobacter pylori]OMQ19803.1 type I restriction endonuclease subunit S [Helicobacter pylori]
MDALMLPSNWQKVRLGDILTLKHGRDYKNFKLGNIPVYGSGGYMLSINNFLHNGESVCIGRKGTIDKPIYLNGKFWVVDTLFYSYSFKKSIPKFIFYAFFIIKWSNYNEATGVPSLTKMTISNIEIPLPPLNEQIAIANILSGLDRYLYNLDALILKKESVKKALSFELLSQRKRLKGFNQAWQRVRLGTYKYRRGSFPQPYGNPQWYSDNGMPFVQVYDVGENFKLTQRTKQKISKIAQPMSVFVPKNSVIITLQGTIGRVALTQYDCYCDRTILIFDNHTLNDVNKYFFVLSLFTKFEEEKRKADGSIIKTITKQTLKDFEIPLPPLNEQIAIADILSALDKEITSLKNKKRQFENIKKALNHDLMSAKIRVLKK